MNAPLLVTEYQETRALVANAVQHAFLERFGEAPDPADRLWERGSLERLALIGDVEAKLGVSFRDEDIEFLDTADDLVERGVAVLMRGGK